MVQVHGSHGVFHPFPPHLYNQHAKLIQLTWSRRQTPVSGGALRPCPLGTEECAHANAFWRPFSKHHPNMKKRHDGGEP